MKFNNLNSFFLTPVIEHDILDIIGYHKNNSATDFMINVKTINKYISKSFTNLIKNSLEEGLF